MAEFGECIWYVRPKSEGKYKADVRWEEGIGLGIRDRSGEARVGTPKGSVKVRSVQRKGSEEERWDRKQTETMTNVFHGNQYQEEEG